MLHDLVDVELALRTRTDKRHVSDEDIPKLGQLIEMMSSQKLPHLGEARVATYLQQVGTILLGIHPHATKLVDEERLAMQSDALLLVDDRHAVLHADGKSTSDCQRREDNKTTRCNEKVKGAFYNLLHFAHAVYILLLCHYGLFIQFFVNRIIALVFRNNLFHFLDGCHFIIRLADFNQVADALDNFVIVVLSYDGNPNLVVE